MHVGNPIDPGKITNFANPNDPARNEAQIHPVRFWTDYEDREGELVAFDYVEWVKKGAGGSSNVQKVSRALNNPVIGSTIQPYYDHWKKGQEAPTSGTPLHAWSGIPPALADRCKSMHLLSVEDLAQADADTLKRLGMGAQNLKLKAQAFIENKDDGSAASKIAALEEENRILQARIEELEARKPVEKPKRKRRTKAEMEAARAEGLA